MPTQINIPVDPTSVKLQKALAMEGLGSRRTMETWIREGVVEVNGQVAEIGMRVQAQDSISVRGKTLKRTGKVRPRICMMNKLTGWEVSVKPSTNARSAFDFLPSLTNGRWLNVGRLDINTSGLILFTNDGNIANLLMHPSTGIDREYAVRINRELSESVLERLLKGVAIEGKHMRFSDIQYYDGSENNHWYHVVLLEGRNREVRRLFESQGVLVSRLKRVRFGPVILPSWLQRGKTMELNPADVNSLCKLIGVDNPRPQNRKEKEKGNTREETRSVLIPYPNLEPS